MIARRIARSNSLPVPADDDWESVWKILDTHEMPSFLYAIADNRNRLVKFGKSLNPAARLKQIKTGNALQLHLCGYCEEKSPLTEAEVHKAVSHHRVSGEWFRLNDETESIIKLIQQEIA